MRPKDVASRALAILAAGLIGSICLPGHTCAPPTHTVSQCNEKFEEIMAVIFRSEPPKCAEFGDEDLAKLWAAIEETRACGIDTAAEEEEYARFCAGARVLRGLDAVYADDMATAGAILAETAHAPAFASGLRNAPRFALEGAVALHRGRAEEAVQAFERMREALGEKWNEHGYWQQYLARAYAAAERSQ